MWPHIHGQIIETPEIRENIFLRKGTRILEIPEDLIQSDGFYQVESSRVVNCDIFISVGIKIPDTMQYHDILEALKKSQDGRRLVVDTEVDGLLLPRGTIIPPMKASAVIYPTTPHHCDSCDAHKAIGLKNASSPISVNSAFTSPVKSANANNTGNYSFGTLYAIHGSISPETTKNAVTAPNTPFPLESDVIASKTLNLESFK